MSDDREKWRAVCAVAEQTALGLRDAGVDDEFAAEISRLIERKAGSYLPPVQGKFAVSLDQAGVNE